MGEKLTASKINTLLSDVKLLFISLWLRFQNLVLQRNKSNSGDVELQEDLNFERRITEVMVISISGVNITPIFRKSK